MAKTKGNAGKAVAVVLALAVLTGGVCACGYAARDDEGKWFKNSDFASWHWADRLPDTSDQDKPAGVPTDGMTVNTVSSNKMRLRAMPMTASAPKATDSSYYLTATVEPADAWEQEIEWIVSFKNPAAAWASGKSASSYINVAPSSDTRNATVTCLGGFGEQIIVTARSKDNPEATATCTCDYIKRAENIVFNLSEPNVYSMTYTYDIEYTPYTIDSQITLTSAKIEGEYGFANDIRDRLDGDQIFGHSAYEALMNEGFYIVNAVSATNTTLAIKDNTLKLSDGFRNIVSLTGNYTDNDGEGSYSLNATQMQKLQSAYISAVKASISTYNGVQAVLTFSFNITSNDIIIGTTSKSVNINFTYDNVKVPVSDVSLNYDNIIF